MRRAGASDADGVAAVWLRSRHASVPHIPAPVHTDEEQLYVDPAATGTGLGSRLVDLAKAANPKGLDLWTFQANTGARRFYERRGFIAGATTNGDNEEAAPDVQYHWSG